MEKLNLPGSMNSTKEVRLSGKSGAHKKDIKNNKNNKNNGDSKKLFERVKFRIKSNYSL